MILFNFFIGFFAIFISPYIFISYKFQKLEYSLTILYGFVISFTLVWISTLVSYYLNLPNMFFYVLAILMVITSLYYFYKLHKQSVMNGTYIFIWLLGIILLLPIFKYAGSGFTEWDALVSWHKWALDLYKNEYHPINAAYPVLMPSLLSVIYKIQGTSEIWWTAKISLFALPLFSLVLPLSLYKDSKNISFLLIAILLYPYLLMPVTINGMMDMPVMLMGIITLTSMLAAEVNKNNQKFEYYAFASILMGGLTSITKQSGIPFLIFDIIYILFNLHYFSHKRKLLKIIIISLLFFPSFLSIYYLNAIAGATGNLDLLISLSQYTFDHKALMWDKFFSYPPSIPLFNPLLHLLNLPIITPYLMGLAFVFFIIFGRKKYTTITLLSLIFVLIGFFAWGKYASYHERNSYWIKAFLILFIAINFRHFLCWFQKQKISYLVIYIPILFLLAFYFIRFNNAHAYSIQESFQKKLGWEGIAKDITKLVRHKDKCLHIYTNDFTLLYNYHTRNIQNRITSEEFNLNNLKDIVQHKCRDGRYITFRGSTRSYALWKKHISRLIYEKKILPYNGTSGYLFYIPPNIYLPKDYFDERTIFVQQPIENYDNHVIFTIDTVNEDSKSYHIDGWAYNKNSDPYTTSKYIVLKNGEQEYIIPTDIVLRPDVASHYKIKQLIKSGFRTYIYKNDFSMGIYSIYILLIEKKGKEHLIDTHKTLHINNNKYLKKDQHDTK